ncbi:hypothetical protein DB30_07749 [Enhygromyxa salina]|uniref:Uncharacterized protein n=1 Tax=Enhygromyxa salina TaxID=215803 RepID=A0A0C1ZMS6_9BACT|nr:hypothetical protein [Enhygromyxa salina]KIG18734.1 hypothetical protein DB30_07749 [Enhygromyxa salina]
MAKAHALPHTPWARPLAGLLARLRRRGKRAPSPIASLGPGWAVVRGRARAGSNARRAPISGRLGLGWRVLVERECGVRGWEPVVDLCEFVNFELQDPSGSICVRACDCPIVIEVAERRGRGGPFAPPPFVVAQLIARAAREPSAVQGVLFHKGFRWREWVLEAGSEILVRGRVISEPGDESTGYRALTEVLVLAGGTTRPLELTE